ncbi:MAG: beta-galactosidase [Solobacterium sp.]|nr:beta-galactosidase [Solobacterium sp.]
MSWWTNYPWRMVQTNFREIDMADVDAEKFAQDLADFGATVVTLNAGGILASYPSELPFHTVSSYLTGSSLKEMVEACHAKGIKVIARMDFSKIPYAVYEQHPDWAFITAEGKIIEQNGFVQTCQNSEYQQEKVIGILEELLSTHPFDGVYCNMSGFIATDYDEKIHGFCTCENCRKGFKAATGMDVPAKMDMRDPAMMRYMGYQSAVGAKLRAKMNKAIKAIDPEIALDKVDYLRTESHTAIGEPVWVYSASSNSRITSGAARTLVSDNASVDFMGFRYRESSVSPGVLELRQWQNLANSGSTSIYIMGRLDNHRDKAVFAGTKDVFRFHKKHEDIISGLSSAAEVLLVSKSRQGRYDPEQYGWVRVLTASHIPFDEVRANGVSEAALAGKKVVILADAMDLNDEKTALIDVFAKKGGIVISSGDSGVRGKADTLKCLGVAKATGKTKTKSTVFTVKKDEEQLFAKSSVSPVIAAGDEVTQAEFAEGIVKYLNTEPEPRLGPPEVCYPTEVTEDPGVTVYAYGSGKGIFIPWKCGSFYHAEGYTNTLNFMQDVLYSLAGLKNMAPDMHPTVELVYSRKEGKKVISLINGSGYFGNSFFEPVEMHDIVLEIPGTYDSAEALNGGTATLTVGESVTEVHLDVLKHFEMIVLKEC